MWLKRISLVVAAAVVVIAAAPDFADSEVTQDGWTVAIYMSGDNSLSENVQQDLDEMASALIDQGMNVVALVDQDAVGDSRVLTWGVGRWIEFETSVVNSSWGSELDLGAPETLKGFVEWASSIRPFEGSFPNLALDLWGHGAGWAGVCMDRGSWLTMPEVAIALDGLGIDLLSIDACQMGMIEVAYELRDCAGILVASEKDVPAEGWHYGDWLNGLREADDSAAGGIALARAYMSWAQNHSAYSATIAVINLARLDILVGPLESLSLELKASWPLLRANITNARMMTERYDGDAEYDLAHFVRNIASRGGSAKLTRLAKAVEDQLAWTIVYSDAWTRAGDEPAEHANGLSIWFPSSGTLPSYAELSFASDTSWDEFLNAYSSIPTHQPFSILLEVVGVDSNLDGITDEMHAALETDAPGSAYFEFIFNQSYVLLNRDLINGKASATLEFLGESGFCQVWAYVYGNDGTLVALRPFHEIIAIEAWLYVNGTVSDGSGSPVQGALVELSWAGGSRLATAADEEGVYSFRIIYPTQFINGTLTVIVDGKTASVDASGPGAVTIDVVLEEEAKSFGSGPFVGLFAVGLYLMMLLTLWSREK
jgi:hypothetical protein